MVKASCPKCGNFSIYGGNVLNKFKRWLRWKTFHDEEEKMLVILFIFFSVIYVLARLAQ